ncbi:translation initiation factor IF-3 [Candidatus Uhrbacteria bacterium]|nr:translation initiation factor IF-3 [Candidatus Uhrbacteria bacterium]
MRISRRRPQKPQGPLIRFNTGITAPQVRVINDQGEHLDVMDTAAALTLAREQGLDLVLINPNAQPPIAKITDYGRYKYQKTKEMRKQKAHAKEVEVKGVRLSLRIGDHDLGVRREMAQRFMDEGNRVRIEIILRGRERQHVELARKILQDFVALFTEIRIDQPFQKQGGVLSMVIAKK